MGGHGRISGAEFRAFTLALKSERTMFSFGQPYWWQLELVLTYKTDSLTTAINTATSLVYYATSLIASASSH